MLISGHIGACLKGVWYWLWGVKFLWHIFRLSTSLLEEKSVVPYTRGPHKTPTGESCLVAFFSDGQQVQRAKAFINTLKMENVSIMSFPFLLSYVVHIMTTFLAYISQIPWLSCMPWGKMVRIML